MPSKDKRIFGIDYGLARLGLAVSDASQKIAFPLQFLKAEKKAEFTVKNLLAFIDVYCKNYYSEIALIVIGMPVMMDGSKGMLADEVDHFAAILKTMTSIPVVTWDERLTTVMAERSLRESTLTRKKRAKVVDSISAGLMLQNYLDSKHASG